MNTNEGKPNLYLFNSDLKNSYLLCTHKRFTKGFCALLDLSILNWLLAPTLWNSAVTAEQRCSEITLCAVVVFPITNCIIFRCYRLQNK